ncbi:ABC transporter permease [Halogeometricum borinquense]|uniref:ABC-type dipeptide/oligopeptide/nickel transport system, permease component n=2 Tax=Halogeometricum borinquense TaxID=60847 RepID=E4NMN6_HALBP|nr:ABC transporter permease [Halogeometricum borinquense]ADQ66191.1 ABC-type dipeptide/oligopeptide/nickel transport system, permease component [Halogeometricum borinquense DSM 11551]ELY27314.1 dipeptide/oligopeptide/nickel ABC transporter permease [Halogeometricum borinquense DSM 11551]QIB75838.1 ABC transporter permease [Halogeometricum borinquense]QIQ75580.1 ABC transporter permease [Halogeometricum borinquense]RYJ14775.1 ABC transporter permease [Halogeometricum borinquense]
MGRLRYTISRLLQSIPVIVGVITITFFLTDAIPGDPVQIMLGPSPSAQQAAAIRAKFGLDQPVHVRYFKYLLDVVQLKLGTSIYYGVPVTQKIAERLPITLYLLLSSFTFALITAVPLGIISAKRRNKPTDHVSRIVALLGVSTPSFWIGLMLIIIFSFWLDIFPATNIVLPWAAPAAVDGAANQIDVILTSIHHLILPTITLGTLQMAAFTRIERSSMLEVLGEEYVKLARAYGVSESKIVRKHAFRNAQLPLITLVGLQLTSALGGAVLTETVFSINGMGRLIITAIQNQDFQLVMGTTLVFGLVFVIGVILTDLSYAYVDPRVSFEGEE